MMPILPFIEDNFENIKAILDKTKENGGSFVLPWLAVSLRDRQKEYYYQKLDLLFPNLRKRYENTYRQITCNSLKSKELYHQIASHCQKIGLSLGVGKKFINESKQLNFNF
ncbi:MAG: hypothetical protein BWY78_00939 [Alphaproteobacteria bacterium ADurb.Bin438]|nr:MAG: hypothetical protein BWY78_00939 [Alphaproteobacteria bacterium ADurb.Bin438]